jgi:hypothetical protein
MLSPEVRQVTQLVRIHSHLLLIFQLYGLGHLASPNPELTSETTNLSSEILAHMWANRNCLHSKIQTQKITRTHIKNMNSDSSDRAAIGRTRLKPRSQCQGQIDLSHLIDYLNA